jgi:hypothetical protein
MVEIEVVSACFFYHYHPQFIGRMLMFAFTDFSSDITGRFFFQLFKTNCRTMFFSCSSFICYMFDRYIFAIIVFSNRCTDVGVFR